MITEKYGRMMESTVPEEYEEIKDNFPPKSEKAKEIVKSDCTNSGGMDEGFCQKLSEACS